MLKINNLVELIDIANVELEHDIPDGTMFEYKNNFYIVKRIFESCSLVCTNHCDLKEDFENDIVNSHNCLYACSDDCPFGTKSVAVKLSEIEALILTGGKNA